MPPGVETDRDMLKSKDESLQQGAAVDALGASAVEVISVEQLRRMYHLFEVMDADVASSDNGTGTDPNLSEQDKDMEEISQVDGPGDSSPLPKKAKKKAKAKAKAKAKKKAKAKANAKAKTKAKAKAKEMMKAKAKAKAATPDQVNRPKTLVESHRTWMELFKDPAEQGKLSSWKQRLIHWELEEQLMAVHKFLRLPRDSRHEDTQAIADELWLQMTNPKRCLDCLEKHKHADSCSGKTKSFNGIDANTMAYFYYFPPHQCQADAEDTPCKICTSLHGIVPGLLRSDARLLLAIPVWDAGLLGTLAHCGTWTSITAYDEVERKRTTTFLHHELVDNRHCFYLNRPQHAGPLDPVMRTIQAIIPPDLPSPEAPKYDLLTEVIDYQTKILEQIMKNSDSNKTTFKERALDDDNALEGGAYLIKKRTDLNGGKEPANVDSKNELLDINEPTVTNSEEKSQRKPHSNPLDEDKIMHNFLGIKLAPTVGDPSSSEAKPTNQLIPSQEDPDDDICNWCNSRSHSWMTCTELDAVVEQLDILEQVQIRKEGNAKVGLCDTPTEEESDPLSLKTFRKITRRRQSRRDPGTTEEIPLFLTRKFAGVPLIVQVAIEEQLKAVHALCIEPTTGSEMLAIKSPLVRNLVHPLLCLQCWDNHAIEDPCSELRESPLFQMGENPWTMVRVLYPLSKHRDGCTHGFQDFCILDGGYFDLAVRNTRQWEERCTLRASPITSRMVYTRNLKRTMADFYVIHRDTPESLRVPTPQQIVNEGCHWNVIAQITASPAEIAHCMKHQLKSLLRVSCLEKLDTRTERRLYRTIYQPRVCLQCGSLHKEVDCCTWNIPLLQSGAQFSRLIRVRSPILVGPRSRLIFLTDTSGAEFASLPEDEQQPVAAHTVEFQVLDGGAFVPMMTNRIARTHLVHHYADRNGQKTAVMVMTRPNCFEIEVADLLTDLQLQWFKGISLFPYTTMQLDAVMPKSSTLLAQQKCPITYRPQLRAVRRSSQRSMQPSPLYQQKPNCTGWRTPDSLNPNILALLFSTKTDVIPQDPDDDDIFPPPAESRLVNIHLWNHVCTVNHQAHEESDHYQPPILRHDQPFSFPRQQSLNCVRHLSRAWHDPGTHSCDCSGLNHCNLPS